MPGRWVDQVRRRNPIWCATRDCGSDRGSKRKASCELSRGAGSTRHLALAGVPVLEVTSPNPARRRTQGKDDSLDAIAAAEAALWGRRV